jgi:Flp pilus assembly CpaE family ATPase
VFVYGPDVPAASGIVLDPDNPGGLIARIESELAVAARNNVIVVTGTGGGVGTTTVALHLALNAARDRSTCCLGGQGLGLRLDLPPEIPTWSDDAAEIHDVATPIAGGFRVVIAPGAAAGAVDAARASFEAVFVDASLPDVDTMLSARAVVLVFPPTVPGVRTASDLVHEHPDVRWALVTNRLGPGGEMTRVALEQILERRIAVELPTCAPLRDAEDDGRLLTASWYRWPRRIAQLWNTLERS